MSTEYVVTVHRKCDKKAIAKFICNQLKNIMDSEFSGMIHCDGRHADKSEFTADEVSNVAEATTKKIDKLYNDIYEKKMAILLAKNVDIKHDIEEDIHYIKEEIEELNWVLYSANAVIGMISCVTEDLIKGKKAAYEYNGKDLPKEKHTYGNGDEYECTPTVWNADVYCRIEAC